MTKEKTYGQRILAMRNAAGYSQWGGARTFGCAISAWCAWERDERLPRGFYRKKMDQWLKRFEAKR